MEEEKEREEAEDEAAKVADFVCKEVTDWNDEMKSRARFKALSGQKSDWLGLYIFWRDLIVKVARHLGIFIIQPSRVTGLWFRRHDGVNPLCLRGVLVEMHRAGELLALPSSEQPNYYSFGLSSVFRKALGFLTSYGGDDQSLLFAGDYFILAPLLEERALQVVDVLSESHWTASCVVTMKKFQGICGGAKEAAAILSYLSACGMARHIMLNRTEPMEGVKVCLATGAVSTTTSMDYSVLHLIWTAEKLEQQLCLIDQRHQKTRNMALASLNSGNKKVALRFAKELKLASLSRERCTALLDRVENVLRVIADSESSNKVSEAIQNSTHAIKENMTSVEEVEHCLQEVDENIDSLKRLDDILESNPGYSDIEDEDIEDEFNKLLLDIKNETNQVAGKVAEVTHVPETTDALIKALSSLNLKDDASTNSVVDHCVKEGDNKSMSKEEIFEAA